MEIPGLTRTLFSEKKGNEKAWRWTVGIGALLLAAALYLFWDYLTAASLIISLQQLRLPLVELFIKAVTYLGDEQLFMLLIPVIYWCVSKSLGFWAAVMLVISGTCGDYIKELTAFPRPAGEGLTNDGSYAFPSGHTANAVTMWGYLALRIKKKTTWILAAAAIIMVGCSRMILGLHFPADVIGGVLLGVVLLSAYIGLGVFSAERRWASRLPFLLLLFLAAAVPVVLAIVIPLEVAPKTMGYLAGGSLGYLLELNILNTAVRGKYHQQLLKIIIGLAGIIGIISGLSPVLPSAVPALGFVRYALAGLWVTCLAPLIFSKVGLSVK